MSVSSGKMQTVFQEGRKSQGAGTERMDPLLSAKRAQGNDSNTLMNKYTHDSANYLQRPEYKNFSAVGT